jgi:hypothetical protein
MLQLGATACESAQNSESTCADAKDEDCDSQIDCADADCDEKACGNGLTCRAGTCKLGGVKPLPPLTNVTTTVDHDNVIIRFLPEAGAKDYRVWLLDDPKAVLQRADGSTQFRGATYRCAGARPLAEFPGSIAGDVWNYDRREAESVLGYVYPNAGPGRVPVFALGHAGSEFDDHDPSAIYQATRMHVFVTDEGERQRLLAQSFRDDGIAFYVPEAGADRTVYWMLSEAQPWVQDRRFGLLYTEGGERKLRASQGKERPLFKVFGKRAPGTLPLYRVNYATNAIHDELALGEAMRDRLLRQGNQPASVLHWSGLTERSTLVVEALDRGCPFRGILAAEDAPAAGHAKPVQSLGKARQSSATAEVWINGQHRPSGNPVAIARSFVTVEPRPAAAMQAYFDFLRTGIKQHYKLLDSDDGVSAFHYVSNAFDLYFYNVEEESLAVGEALGQLWVGYADLAADTNGKFRLTANQMAELAADRFLHVMARMDIPSTLRRYPQIMVSTLRPPIQPALASGTTVIVQPFGTTSQLQLQVCKNRSWDVNDQCPQAPLGDPRKYGPKDVRFPPQPVAAEQAAFDHLARFDLFVSTERVYIYFEGRPYGCGVLPKGSWKAGPVSVTLGDVLYHSGVDEAVVCDDCPHHYLKRFSLTQSVRKFDSFGFTSGTTLPSGGGDLPQWDERVLPCTTDAWEVL